MKTAAFDAALLHVLVVIWVMLSDCGVEGDEGHVQRPNRIERSQHQRIPLQLDRCSLIDNLRRRSMV